MKKKPGLKPDPEWDGSVVSLMNYPEIVTMMSDDLDWTEALASAVTNQQQDVLDAIQQLREKAVAEGIIKTDEKVKVVKQEDNIVIQPAKADTVYIPQYPPEMLYEPDYVYQPIAYYPEPYPSYYDPVAPFFAGVVTGIFWAGIVDWNNGGFWGGGWNGGDIDIDCNNCFNNRDFNGRLNANDIDWRNVDRSKISFDKNQLSKIDNTKLRNNLERNANNNIRNRSDNLKGGDRVTNRAGKGNAPRDIRKSTLEGLNKQAGGKFKDGGALGGNKAGTMDLGGGQLGAGNKAGPGRAGDLNPTRPAGKPKAGAKIDSRPAKASPLGDMNRGRDAKMQSKRGGQSRGGGMNMGGGGAPKMSNFSGSRHSYGGGGGKRPPIRRGGGRRR